MGRRVGCLSIPTPLRSFYSLHDGAFVFNRALLIRPYKSVRGVRGLVEWNDPSLWKCEYELNLEDYVFFAEDVVGFSYCLGLDHRVYFFDPEQGVVELIAESVDAWAESICGDSREVGASLAISWISDHGEIPYGYRLAPLVPFVMKESEGIGNVLAPELPLARFRGSLARSLSSAPDGEQLRVRSITDFLRMHK